LTVQVGDAMSSETNSLATREKLGYGLGDCAANFAYQMQINFLLYYYTDVLRITPSAAGRLLLVSRVVDAVNDPIIGVMADRTNSRWGRYRPWVLLTAIPLAITLVLCFTTPPFTGSGKIVWAYVTYNLLMLVYAANNIPYSALSGVMTDDPLERTGLLSWRFVCAMVAVFIVNTFTLYLVDYFGNGNDAKGFQLTMALWGAIVVPLMVITFTSTRERIPMPFHQRTTVRQNVRSLFRNGPWVVIFLMSVLTSIQASIRGGTLPYYFNYFLRRKDLLGPFNAIGIVAIVIGVACSKPLAARIGKRDAMRVCLLLSAALMTLFALVPRKALLLLFLLQFLLPLAIGPTIPILWAMMSDVADYSEWKHGHQSTALAFASLVFGGKLGSGIGGWLNGALFDYFGYTAGSELSESAARGIIWMFSVIPATALLLGLFTIMFYRIDEPMERLIESTLRERRERIRLSVESTSRQTPPQPPQHELP
jgi:glycoside/pentoside/hexuronide:cation symporter, GPH family